MGLIPVFSFTHFLTLAGGGTGGSDAGAAAGAAGAAMMAAGTGMMMMNPMSLFPMILAGASFAKVQKGIIDYFLIFCVQGLLLAHLVSQPVHHYSGYGYGYSHQRRHHKDPYIAHYG